MAVFDPPLDNLQRNVGSQRPPFPILADADNVHYLRGWFTRLPELLKAMFLKGYFPTSCQGALTTMPVDVLVDECGSIAHLRYGRDAGDHLPIAQVTAFAHGDPRGQAATPAA